MGVVNVGAVTLVRAGGTSGSLSSSNSVLGTAASGGPGLDFGYDPARGQLVVGRGLSNIVSLFTLPVELVFANGFE